MERRSFIKHTGLAGILAAGSAPAFAQAAPKSNGGCASSFPKSLDTIFGGAEVISKVVAAATNNKFQIQVFAGGEIVPPFGVVDAVQNATVQCCHTAPYYFFGKDATFAFGCAIPFGMNNRQQNAWMYHGGGASSTTIS
jgi:TRAP-type mannitol/chloroaromatic compound transport system substrate-binding protein